MDNKKNGIPKLRFPGFTGAWEQRKLGEVATRVTRKNKNLESTLPLTISAQLGLVDQISYFDKRIASSNLTNYILLNRGEFAYNKSYSNGYPFGTVKRLNRYDKGVIPSLYIAFMPNTIFINSDFMEMYFETSLWHKEVSTRASEGARNHGLLNISPSDFMDIYMKIPEKIEEQKKIAKFLEDFDSLIALHQRKLEHLQEQKKGLLQKMFPKNGETVPEVRFPGFTDAWEQRKLGEYFPNILSGNRLPKTMIVKGDVPYVIATTENNGVGAYLSENQKDYSNNNMKKFDRNSITVSIDNPEAIFIQTKTFVASNVMRVLHNSKLDFDELNFFKQILKIKAKGFDWSSKFSGPVIKNISFFAPSDNKEMQKIGKVITNLDSLIALHQRKLEHLELMKKGLLQQMFV